MPPDHIRQLSVTQRDEALGRLPAWSYAADRKALYRRIVFKDFVEAICMMIRIGIAAEASDHHPEWSNVYNVLDFWLTTHDADGVSPRDLALAAAIDQIVGI